MSVEEWRIQKLEDVIIFNPREFLRKNELAKKVTMQDLDPYNKKIRSWSESRFSGGTKFKNGDTLLARITPCLENGKTAFVDILAENEVGFGSTEFIVMRAIDGLMDKNYVYYLSISPSFRKVAIHSMSGSSGRQRVQLDVIKKESFHIPPLEEQKAIARVLSTIDDKIELNNQINQDIEEMAQAIFRSWFVDFEPFQDGEFVESELGRIPKGWKVGRFGDIAQISSGKRPENKKSRSKGEYLIPVIGASKVMGYVKRPLYEEPILVIGRVGTHGVVQRVYGKSWPSDNTLVIKTTYYEFVYHILKRMNYESIHRGSTQPLITKRDLSNKKIIVPDKKIMNDFEDMIGKFTSLSSHNQRQNLDLIQLRDTLLPKLISGELRFPSEEGVIVLD